MTRRDRELCQLSADDKRHISGDFFGANQPRIEIGRVFISADRADGNVNGKCSMSRSCRARDVTVARNVTSRFPVSTTLLSRKKARVHDCALSATRGTSGTNQWVNETTFVLERHKVCKL